MPIYPAPYKSLEEFQYLDDLYLTRTIAAVQTRRGKDADYIVGDHYRARVEVRRADDSTYSHCICVPKGYMTDLVSVPKLGRLFVGRVGPYLEACIFHDWLYEAWIVLGQQPQWSMKEFADDVVKLAMEKAKVGGATRRIINFAVRKLGGSEFRKARGEKITVPKVDTIIKLPNEG